VFIPKGVDSVIKKFFKQTLTILGKHRLVYIDSIEKLITCTLRIGLM